MANRFGNGLGKGLSNGLGNAGNGLVKVLGNGDYQVRSRNFYEIELASQKRVGNRYGSI